MPDENEEGENEPEEIEGVVPRVERFGKAGADFGCLGMAGLHRAISARTMLNLAAAAFPRAGLSLPGCLGGAGVPHPIQAAPRMRDRAWMSLGILELICMIGLVVPSALRWHPKLTVVAAAILAMEALVFIWVHVKYHEMTPIIMSAVLGLLMAFIAYGRLVLKPIF
jgi:hypothetical protein